MRNIDPSLLGKILIIEIPHTKKAPIDISLEWVGLTLTCMYKDDEKEERSIDASSGERVEWHPTYAVSQALALELLREKSPRAARYWEKQGFPKGAGAMFFFDTDVVEELKPVMSKGKFRQLYLRTFDA